MMICCSSQGRKEQATEKDGNGHKENDKAHKERYKRSKRDESDSSGSDSEDEFKCFAQSSCLMKCWSGLRLALKKLVNHR